MVKSTNASVSFARFEKCITITSLNNISRENIIITAGLKKVVVGLFKFCYDCNKIVSSIFQ